MSEKRAVIVGGGPAGLTAAYELVTKSAIQPIIIEADSLVGGISRTINYKGNRIDLGGHRFFSKSDKVVSWWQDILPLQGSPAVDAEEVEISYQKKRQKVTLVPGGPDPGAVDDVMLIRPRVSRILFKKKFFDYPLNPSFATLHQLGFVAALRIIGSFGISQLSPIKPEMSLQDFIINRFGRELYKTFFQEYTEKVWGVPCHEIPADWGRQRIKGVSVASLISHALRSLFGKAGGWNQKEIETSLIEQFMYPKLGPGQLWEKVAWLVVEKGGELRLGQKVVGLNHDGNRVQSVRIVDSEGKEESVSCDWCVSTMPIKHIVTALSPNVPEHVKDVTNGLMYRDFMTVGLLLNRLKLGGDATGRNLYSRVPDNWIYIQEPGVKLGRLQIFNNWSPYMVADRDHVWVGLEYFVDKDEQLWRMADEEVVRFAVDELVSIDVIDRDAVLDHTVIRMPKAYPAYFGTFNGFNEVKEYLLNFSNLYPVGRNGMHRYNNQDHSMLTAMTAAHGIMFGEDVRQELWQINTEQEYHEEK